MDLASQTSWATQAQDFYFIFIITSLCNGPLRDSLTILWLWHKLPGLHSSLKLQMKNPWSSQSCIFFFFKKKKKYHMGNIVNFCTQLEIAPGHLDLSCRRFWIQHSHNLEAHPSGVLPSQHISCCSCPDHTASLQQIQTLFQHKIEVLSFLVMFAFLYTFKISSYQICCPNNHATDSTLWCVKI